MQVSDISHWTLLSADIIEQSNKGKKKINYYFLLILFKPKHTYGFQSPCKQNVKEKSRAVLILEYAPSKGAHRAALILIGNENNFTY